MIHNFDQAILHLHLSEFKISGTFKELAEKQGYHCLADLLKKESPYSLLDHEGFSMHLLMEYVDLLKSYGLEPFIAY